MTKEALTNVLLTLITVVLIVLTVVQFTDLTSRWTMLVLAAICYAMDMVAIPAAIRLQSLGHLLVVATFIFF